MKKKVILKRIFHREKWRIAICFDFDVILKNKVKSISGSVYSITHQCFYVDETEDNLMIVLKALKDIADVDINFLVRKGNKPENSQDPFVPGDVDKLSSPDNSDEKKKFAENSLTKSVNKMDEEFHMAGRVPGRYGKGNFGGVEFRISEPGSKLIIKFLGRYDSEWIREMKSYGPCSYDQSRKEWQLSWTKMTCDSLADYFSGKDIEVRITKQVINQELKSERKATGDRIRARMLSGAATEGLDMLASFLRENRYSPRTRESYLAMLEFFFRNFSPKDPSEITEGEISDFINEFIIRLGYSAAYQNQMVSAIKTYYEISGKGKVNPSFLNRPRRSRALPKVFSKEEVSLILNSEGNIKHKLLLWIIYSCGLRRSEVTNIRLVDLDRGRGLINIREGKGMVDRVVPVSDKVWNKIEEYMRCYRPGEYLFEGQTGGKYSSESVYRVFKGALQKAGIKKDVGVHSLRHSYATHLHESGLDIRYIQELLGHKNSRTTEIYTHVSRRNLIQVRSPIEDMDVK